MAPVHSELRIPADPAFVMVAKRATAGFAAVAGLDLEALDDLVIAVAQACEHTIVDMRRIVGSGVGQLKLEFHIDGPCMHVHLAPLLSRAEVEIAKARREVARARTAELLALRREAELKKQHAAEHREHEEARAASELALNLMALFVDDFGYRVDDRTGAARVRLTKYREQ